MKTAPRNIVASFSVLDAECGLRARQLRLAALRTGVGGKSRLIIWRCAPAICNRAVAFRIAVRGPVDLRLRVAFGLLNSPTPGLRSPFPVPSLGARPLCGEWRSGGAPTSRRFRSSGALWHRGGVHSDSRSRGSTPHGQSKPWGSIRKYSLHSLFRIFRFVLFACCCVCPCRVLAICPYSFRLPLLSGIRGGVRNSRDEYNTVMASRTVPLGVGLPSPWCLTELLPDGTKGGSAQRQ